MADTCHQFFLYVSFRFPFKKCLFCPIYEAYTQRKSVKWTFEAAFKAYPTVDIARKWHIVRSRKLRFVRRRIPRKKISFSHRKKADWLNKWYTKVEKIVIHEYFLTWKEKEISLLAGETFCFRTWLIKLSPCQRRKSYSAYWQREIELKADHYARGRSRGTSPPIEVEAMHKSQ